MRIQQSTGLVDFSQPDEGRRRDGREVPEFPARPRTGWFYILASFPEVTKVVSQSGAPDDGTDTGGFGNTEYFVDLKPKDQWRPVFHQSKEELIAAMDRELEKHPGAFWNFSQPIEDNVDETMTGTKGGLCAKLYGPELDVLEEKGEQIKDVMSNIDGVKDLGIQRIPASRISISPLTGRPRRASVSMWPIYKTPSRPPLEVILSARFYRAKQCTTW